MPQVQDDVFYAQPLPVKAAHPGGPGESNTTTENNPTDVGTRDVRFSSPLEGVRQTNKAGSQPNKSSLKKGASSRQAQSQIQPVSIDKQADQQVLTIVVNPVSRNINSTMRHDRPNMGHFDTAFNRSLYSISEPSRRSSQRHHRKNRPATNRFRRCFNYISHFTQSTSRSIERCCRPDR